MVLVYWFPWRVINMAQTMAKILQQWGLCLPHGHMVSGHLWNRLSGFLLKYFMQNRQKLISNSTATNPMGWISMLPPRGFILHTDIVFGEYIYMYIFIYYAQTIPHALNTTSNSKAIYYHRFKQLSCAYSSLCDLHGGRFYTHCLSNSNIWPLWWFY